jgi:ATP phosphoribosyltransferase regulatory subunit HisZ
MKRHNPARWKVASGAIFIDSGAEEAIVPALWSQDTFVEKAGGSEIIGQIWAFPDKKGRPCCLIPEATALFQERCQELLEGRRERMLFYVARCYRYERPQAGRYREFLQLGFEYLCPDPERALVRSRELVAGFLDSLGPQLLPERAGVRDSLQRTRRTTASGRWGRVSGGRGFWSRRREVAAGDGHARSVGGIDWGH